MTPEHRRIMPPRILPLPTPHPGRHPTEPLAPNNPRKRTPLRHPWRIHIVPLRRGLGKGGKVEGGFDGHGPGVEEGHEARWVEGCRGAEDEVGDSEVGGGGGGGGVGVGVGVGCVGAAGVGAVGGFGVIGGVVVGGVGAGGVGAVCGFGVVVGVVVGGVGAAGGGAVGGFCVVVGMVV